MDLSWSAAAGPSFLSISFASFFFVWSGLGCFIYIWVFFYYIYTAAGCLSLANELDWNTKYDAIAPPSNRANGINYVGSLLFFYILRYMLCLYYRKTYAHTSRNWGGGGTPKETNLFNFLVKFFYLKSIHKFLSQFVRKFEKKRKNCCMTLIMKWFPRYFNIPQIRRRKCTVGRRIAMQKLSTWRVTDRLQLHMLCIEKKKRINNSSMEMGVYISSTKWTLSPYPFWIRTLSQCCICTV